MRILLSLPWEETTSECSQNLTEPKNPNNRSCLQLVNKQVSRGTQRLQLIMAIGHSFQAGTTALSDSDDKCSNQMRVVGFYTVDKLSAAVCISLLFSPVTRTVTQNLRDCFANISFFLQSIRTPESWSEPPHLGNRAKAKRDSGALPVLCQFSASSARLLRTQSSF